MYQFVKKTFNKPWIFFCMLLLVLLVSNIYSIYHIHQLKDDQNRISYQTEAMYQRTFGELVDSVQIMNEQLAKLLVTVSREQLLYGLSGLWREVYSAISSLGTLPIAMHQLEQTDLLLHDLAEYSYYLMRENVLHQEPLSSQDWKQLEDFYQRSGIIEQELERLESSLLTDNFRLATLSIHDEENLVATTFRNIESQVCTFPEISLEEGVRKIETKPQPLQGTRISEAEAISKADEFLSMIENTKSTVSTQASASKGNVAFVSDSTTLPVYGIVYPDNQYIEVSCIAGRILQYYHNRELHPARLSITQAENQAQSILYALGICNMACVESTMEGNTASFIFVPVQNQIYLYPDMIKLQLALDDGTLLSLDLTGYQTRHHKRTLSTPQTSPDAIPQNCNPNFTITNIRLALILDEYSANEVLVYELRGNIADDEFAIFVDTDTGQELRIVRL